ncbi:MAG: hypothetical protein ACRBCJ_09430 [Hyphomicrobiaceae bacterium]
MQIRRGSFMGINGHTMRGRFKLTEKANGAELETSDDFFFDGKAPAPAWALGDGQGKFVDDTVFRNLIPFSEVFGRRTIFISDKFKPSDAGAVIAWCDELDVELGVGIFDDE